MNRNHVLLVLALMPNAAQAALNCFTVYGPDNAVVYRSRESPIDLSRPISAAMDEKFPGSHMVWTRDDEPCREVDALSTLSRAIQGDRLYRSSGSALFTAAPEARSGDLRPASQLLVPANRVRTSASASHEGDEGADATASGAVATGHTRATTKPSGAR